MQLKLRERPGKAVESSVGLVLLECVVALGLIALALPVVVLAFEYSRQNQAGSHMDREVVQSIRQHCFNQDELKKLTAIGPAIWVHASNGRSLGSLSPESSQLLYEQGVVRHWQEREQFAHFLVVAAKGDGAAPVSGLLPMTWSLEFPAAAPASKRRRIELHSLIQP